jgi:hypothetical protein
MLLVPLDADYCDPAAARPDVRDACVEAYGPGEGDALVSLRELLGVIGAHEWRQKGIELPALGGRIHPHYGVFAPCAASTWTWSRRRRCPRHWRSLGRVRHRHRHRRAGGGLLARRGIERRRGHRPRPARARLCARERADASASSQHVEVVEANLFPKGARRSWCATHRGFPRGRAPARERDLRFREPHAAGIPARPARAPRARRRGLAHLSDLAEHLDLRTRDQLLGAFERAGLVVAGRIDARPRHPKAFDESDPLHRARKAEVTSLWRLVARQV